MQLSQKKKFLNFFAFSKLKFKLHMYFWTYGVRKTSLDKYLKSPISEDSSRSNMVKRPKHCWNQKHSTFTIFIDLREGNWDWNIFS